MTCDAETLSSANLGQERPPRALLDSYLFSRACPLLKPAVHGVRSHEVKSANGHLRLAAARSPRCFADRRTRRSREASARSEVVALASNHNHADWVSRSSSKSRWTDVRMNCTSQRSVPRYGAGRLDRLCHVRRSANSSSDGCLGSHDLDISASPFAGVDPAFRLVALTESQPSEVSEEPGAASDRRMRPRPRCAALLVCLRYGRSDPVYRQTVIFADLVEERRIGDRVAVRLPIGPGAACCVNRASDARKPSQVIPSSSRPAAFLPIRNMVVPSSAAALRAFAQIEPLPGAQSPHCLK